MPFLDNLGEAFTTSLFEGIDWEAVYAPESPAAGEVSYADTLRDPSGRPTKAYWEAIRGETKPEEPFFSPETGVTRPPKTAREALTMQWLEAKRATALTQQKVGQAESVLSWMMGQAPLMDPEAFQRMSGMASQLANLYATTQYEVPDYTAWMALPLLERAQRGQPRTVGASATFSTAPMPQRWY